MRERYPEDQDLMREYFKPLSRWTDAIQNDFAARADWCVKSHAEANHPPVVELAHPLDMKARPGDDVSLSARGTYPSGEPHLFGRRIGRDDGTTGVPIAEARPWRGRDAGRRAGPP
jgi:hypothetical protein